MLSLTPLQFSVLHGRSPATTTSPFLYFSDLTTSFDSASVSSPNSLFFIHNRSLHRGASLSVMAKSPKSESSEQKWSHEGSVVESPPNGMFRFGLDNEDLVLGYISGKIRKNFVRILPGDSVRVEVSRYDSTKGRIVYRLRNTKDSSSRSVDLFFVG